MNSVSRPHIYMQVDAYNFIMGLAAFQVIIYQITATANSPIVFLACAFIFYTARILQMSS